MAGAYVHVEVLVDLLGEARALALCEALGGLNGISVARPENMSADHRIARAIGLDGAMRIANEYGGSLIELPLGRQLRTRARQLRIADRLRAGDTHEAIALAEGVSQRQVSQTARALADGALDGQPAWKRPARRTDPRQIDLFEPAR